MDGWMMGMDDRVLMLEEEEWLISAHLLRMPLLTFSHSLILGLDSSKEGSGRRSFVMLFRPVIRLPMKLCRKMK